MVEGHSVHRVATMHRQRLVGKLFTATSPNGRFKEGAAAIDQKIFYRIEAVGKNLFAFFRNLKENENEYTDDDEANDDSVVVVRVHFGMAGNWAVYDNAPDEDIPSPTSTNRLRLQHATLNLVADLSAMTVEYGPYAMYHEKRALLGQDPLRHDANPTVLWNKVQTTSKSIGALLMDQSYFTGPGNIYRAEILFKAGVHPGTPGKALNRTEFDLIWHHTVDLLQRGYQTGSILTVDKDEAKQLGKPKLRRYIYNTSHCPRCQTRIQTWQIANRTCYACPTCQPRKSTIDGNDEHGTVKDVNSEAVNPCVPFNSHCARESVETRLQESGPERLTVAELKNKLKELQVVVPRAIRKAALVQLWHETIQAPISSTANEATTTTSATPSATLASTKIPGVSHIAMEDMISSEAAAAEKAAARESLAVEHIAELAPQQARRARAMTSSATAATVDSSSAAITSTPSKQRTSPRKAKRRTVTPPAVTPSPKKQRKSLRKKATQIV